MRRLILALVAAGGVACAGSGSAGDPRTVRLAIHADPIAFLPIRVAQTLGYYQNENLDVQTSEVAGGTKAMQALLGGSVDVAAASMSDAVQLAVEGRDVRGFVLLFNRPTAALAVAPSLRGTIRSIRDLKGRTVGVSAPGSASHQILNFLLASNGLSPDEVSTVSVGMSASSLAALEHGTVAAAILLSSAIPAFERRQSRDALLIDLRSPEGVRQVFGSDIFPGVALMAQETWLRANADTARRLARAVTRGMQWIRDHPAERVRDMIPEGARMAIEVDLPSIRQLQQVLSTNGRVPEHAMPLIQKFVSVSNPKAASARIDLARTYTNEFTSEK